MLDLKYRLMYVEASELDGWFCERLVQKAGNCILKGQQEGLCSLDRSYAYDTVREGLVLKWNELRHADYSSFLRVQI